MSRSDGRRTTIVFATLAGLASLPTLLLLGAGVRRWLSGDIGGGWMTLAASIVPGLLTAAFAAGAWLTVLGRRKESACADRRARHPGEPWRWASEWEHGRIAADRQRPLAGALLAFAAIWNAATFAAGFLTHQKYGLLRDPAAGLTVLVFATAGVFLIGLAVYQLALALKYVPVVFEMSTFPGRSRRHRQRRRPAPAQRTGRCGDDDHLELRSRLLGGQEHHADLHLAG